jgi:hypothetical protein
MAALRKKLGNAGVDLSNPKLNESFVLVGSSFSLIGVMANGVVDWHATAAFGENKGYQ